MNYEIKGGTLPYLVVKLEAGERVSCEAGAMSWMDPNITMETEGGGVGKVVGRLFTGENLFLNHYTAQSAGEIAFATTFPGTILAVRVTPEKPIVIQKGAFLATVGNVDSKVFFQKKIGVGFFGGEGFIMTQLFGDGVAFIEIDGATEEFELAAGQQKIVDTGYLAMMDGTCSIDIVTVKGVKNVLLGGEGLFNTVITGPGRVVLQTMPKAKVITEIRTVAPASSAN